MMNLIVRGRNDKDIFRSTVLYKPQSRRALFPVRISNPGTSGYDAVSTLRISVYLGHDMIHLQCSLKASTLSLGSDSHRAVNAS